jgi:hypothetical protein
MREMKLTKYEFSSLDEMDSYHPAGGWTKDYREWPGVEMYGRSDDEGEDWYYYLVTDATHMKVIVVAGRM